MWTTPECAYYGLTKEAAEKKGLDVEEGVAKYTDCLRGRVFSPDGLVKLVFQKDRVYIIDEYLDMLIVNNDDNNDNNDMFCH